MVTVVDNDNDPGSFCDASGAWGANYADGTWVVDLPGNDNRTVGPRIRIECLSEDKWRVTVTCGVAGFCYESYFEITSSSHCPPSGTYAFTHSCNNLGGDPDAPYGLSTVTVG